MAGTTQEFDAVVIGAGFSGMYMLKALRDGLGLKVRVYEAGATVGGTWYWNRYPGARCDSESYVYCFTWDKRAFLSYLDPEGVGGYRKRCDEIAAKGYEGFTLA